MENMLATTGLTSSEANHVTNVTKELVKDLDIDRLALAKSSVLKDGKSFPLDENTKKENWVQNIQRVGELFALSAWLKSGIKMKEEILSKATNQIPETPVQPAYEQLPVIQDTRFEAYLNTLTTKERSDYLTNESKAAHIGKFIHNYDQIRKMSEEFRPTVLQEGKNEVIVIQNERLYTKEELSEGFFELQKAHREAEKVVNNYKAKHKEWIKSLEDDYSKEAQLIQGRNKEMMVEYNAQLQKVTAEFEAKKREQKKEISNLRIVIPHALQETLDFVNEYAKK